MRKSSTLRYLLMLFILAAFGSNASAQALTEDFNYTATTLLTANGYTAISAGGTSAITVTAPGLIYAGSPSSGVGNAATMNTSGEDDTQPFTSTINSGDAYASFLINITAAQSGDYFFSLYDGTYITRVYAKASGAGYVLGISKAAGTVTYDATVRPFNTVSLVVLKYSFNTGSTTDDVVSLYVNPALGGTEPSPTIAPIGAGTNDGGTFSKIALRQGSASAAASLIIDGIRVGTTWASVTPMVAPPTPTTTSISPSSANTGDPDFTLTVNGTNFISGSTVTWNGSNRVTTFVSATQLTADIPTTDLSTAGSADVGVTTTGAAATSNTQTFTINSATGPSLTLTSALPDFGNICTNAAAGPGSFTINGNNLDGTDITLSALPGFTYAESAGGPFNSTLSFSYTGAGFTGKQIFVNFAPTAVQAYDGTINLNGGGITNYPVAVTGSGINSLPSLTTGSSTAVTATSGTPSGTIVSSGCTAVTTYGIEYSVNSGFPDGDPTATNVTASNLSAGGFSVTLTSLIPNTRYYYKAFATNAGGTAYGLQQAFTCMPLPVPMAAQTDLTFTEDFSDIANWGSFFSVGNGANHWGGLSASGGTTGIPNGTTITASSTSFQGASYLASGGVQKGTDQIPATTSMVLLSTGSPDNTTSAAMDFYMDFTGVNAGILSFDFNVLSNATGNRNGSLRVYTTTDGVTFTDLPAADIISFTNNVAFSGSKTNVVLPASFNNSATARLRFYYYNGEGGLGTGSRPKISIDNLTVTSVATTPCTSPTAPATNLLFGTITDTTIAGSFTAASPATDNYMVVVSNNSTLTGNPVNGQNYAVGDNVGDGTVIYKGTGTNFTATGLSATTVYYFFVFPVNAVCTGGPLYYTATILNGTATTIAGLPPCAAPVDQPTNLAFGTIGINSIQGSFTAAAAADGYLVLRSTSASLTVTPVTGQPYSTGDIIGNATVVQRNASTTFTANGLAPNTAYYFYVFSLNDQACINGPALNTVSPLTNNQTTNPLPPCIAPSAAPTALVLTASYTSIAGTLTAAPGADDYLVVASLSPTLSATPSDNTDYNVGDAFGSGTIVANTSTPNFLAINLNSNSAYYFFVFAANKNCSGGTKYYAATSLNGNASTTNIPPYTTYFGNLHSHSDYSDGNKDNPTYTPAMDYNYAMTAQCMDYLGISEHNHYSSPHNPGNSIQTYHLGVAQADSFSVANPNFLALYGMEWGVISGGGHVVVYGNGMNTLYGWESGSGGWGPTNNYDVYVPKSVYTGPTGLFRTINDSVNQYNTFATLAHPNLTDFNNIAGTAYDASADSAIVGSAVESGPAFSTNTSYTDPGSSMYYLFYYQALLAKGYHLGPTIDHDNHNTTFGHTAYTRTAILAPDLTKASLVKAMRSMHFYATEACHSKVDFTINTQIMGSLMTDRYGPNISVTLTDATRPTANAIIRVMYGVPGSGTVAIMVDSIIGNTLNFQDANIPDMSTGYYYIDITNSDVTNGTSRIITSPIWYTRNDATTILPIKLNSFAVQKMDNTVKISWNTQQESNSKNFVVERSIDGRSWAGIATVNAAGNSNHSIDYLTYDNAPANGINYYRLKQVDKDGSFEYSVVRSVLFSKSYDVRITPNPATTFVNVYVAKNSLDLTQIIITDVNGKLVDKFNTTDQNKQIYTGSYAKIITGTNITTQKIIVQ